MPYGNQFIMKGFRNVLLFNMFPYCLKTKSTLIWFEIKQVSASSESMYDDAYTIQQVMADDTHNFNYVAGIVPFLFNLIQDVSSSLVFV